jgi:branched-chain amino acid transport system substrate-binding protein
MTSRVVQCAIAITAAGCVALATGCGSSSSGNSTSNTAQGSGSITSGPANNSLSPVNVLFFGDSTGAAAQYDSLNLPPETLAVNDINSHEGGIDGHPLHVQIVDAQTLPAEAVQLYDADASKALAIVSLFGTDFSAIAPLGKANKIPGVTQATATAVISATRPYSWSIGPNTFDTTASAVDTWVKAVPTMKKVVVLEDQFDAQYASEAGEAVKELTKDGISVTGIGYAEDTTDFAPLVSRVKADNPDGIVIGGNSTLGAAIAKELYSQGVKASMLAVQAVYGTPLLTAGSNVIKGMYIYTPLYLGVPAAADFVREYKAATGISPSYASAQCYEMFQILAQALRAAHAWSGGSITAERAAVQAALGRVSITGVNGAKVFFGGNGFVGGSSSDGVLVRLSGNPDGSGSVVQ